MNEPIFKGDIILKPKWYLRSSQCIQELAQFFDDLELSGEETLNWILSEIFLYHEGRLISSNGDTIDILAIDMEIVFGEYGRRWISDFKKFAERKPRQRLQVKCILRIMIMSLAKEIYLERHNLKPKN